MNAALSLYNRYQRYRTLRTDRITALPVLILMPHSACNCRCVMCDIWKDNKNLKQLTEEDIAGLMDSLKKLGTKKLVMSGGEALLSPNFFRLCELVKKNNISISLLSTGLLLKKYAEQIRYYINDVIVSLDGDEAIHDQIRNIPGAFKKLKEGVEFIKGMEPGFRISARSVIQQKNFLAWPAIIEAAKNMGLDSISFLPADVSSHAFNREVLWSDQRKEEILPSIEQLAQLNEVTESIIGKYATELETGFIAEPPARLRKIARYYSAIYGLNEFPYKKCNAPWVSAVIEPDGNIRPCFFHEVMGNIRNGSIESILNSPAAMSFRKGLDVDTNPVCVKCVCYLNLAPGAEIN